MRTCAPPAASASALARPMPREAPVTSAVFPERLGMIVSFPVWRAWTLMETKDRQAGARSLAFGTLLERVHPVWVESQVVPDRRHRVVGSLVGPDGVDGALPA